MQTSALRRFLKYVTYDTRSDEQSTAFPSTPGQLVLLNELVTELRALGLDDAEMDQYGYVMATVPATTERDGGPVIGFIAHVDTSPEMSRCVPMTISTPPSRNNCRTFFCSPGERNRLSISIRIG